MATQEQIDLQKAKIKRAQELVVEAGDMDFGDAAIMFMLAAVMCQKKHFLKLCEEAMTGKGTQRPDFPDREFWKLTGEILGDKYEQVRKDFFESDDFQGKLHASVHTDLKSVLTRCMIAVVAIETLEKKGLGI